MKGHQALVLVPTTPFRFLDLPTEVRDMIYDLIFPDEVTKLKLWVRKSNASKVVGIEHAPRSSAWRKKHQYDSKLEKYLDEKRRVPLNLLQANKQVYHEAFEVLYRSRVFSFACEKTLSRFLELNQDCIQYLMHIILPDLWTVCKAMTVLANVRPKSLQTIEVNHHNSKYHPTYHKGAAGVLEVATELFDTMCQARRKERVKIGLDRVLKFSHQGCKEKGGGADCQKLEAELAELVKEEYPMY